MEKKKKEKNQVMETKKLDLYIFLDHKDEILIAAGTMEEIRKYFYDLIDDLIDDFEESYPDDLEELVTLIESAKTNDEALEKLIAMTWGARIEPIRTITEKDLK